MITIISCILFVVFTLIVIREHENGHLRLEFAYRIWSLGFFPILALICMYIKGP